MTATANVTFLAVLRLKSCFIALRFSVLDVQLGHASSEHKQFQNHSWFCTENGASISPRTTRESLEILGLFLQAFLLERVTSD